MNRNVRKCTFWHVRQTKTQSSLHIRTFWSESSLSAWRNCFLLLITTRTVKILIRPRERAGWSESSPGAYFRRYVFWHCDTNGDTVDIFIFGIFPQTRCCYVFNEVRAWNFLIAVLKESIYEKEIDMFSCSLNQEQDLGILSIYVCRKDIRVFPWLTNQELSSSKTSLTV